MFQKEEARLGEPDFTKRARLAVGGSRNCRVFNKALSMKLVPARLRHFLLEHLMDAIQRKCLACSESFTGSVGVKQLYFQTGIKMMGFS
jgi:hypothetical protein